MKFYTESVRFVHISYWIVWDYYNLNFTARYAVVVLELTKFWGGGRVSSKLVTFVNRHGCQKWLGNTEDE